MPYYLNLLCCEVIPHVGFKTENYSKNVLKVLAQMNLSHTFALHGFPTGFDAIILIMVLINIILSSMGQYIKHLERNKLTPKYNCKYT